jgi:hypothetical protein
MPFGYFNTPTSTGIADLNNVVGTPSNGDSLVYDDVSKVWRFEGISGGITNRSAAVDPSATDDSSSGFVLGSVWYNTVTQTSWVCVSPSGGNAKWLQTGAKNNLSAVVDPVVTDDAGLGYSRGSLWINTAASRFFVASATNLGAAIWVKSGNVVSNASSVNNGITCFDGVSGLVVKSSDVTISSTADIAGAKSLAMSGSVSGTFTMQPAGTTSSYAITMPATQGAKGSSLVNNGSGSLAWQLAGQGGLWWSSAAHGNPTVAPQSILGVFSGSAYWSETIVNGVTSSFVVLTTTTSNQTGACNWNVPSFDFTRDFILRVGFKQDTGASGVQFGVGGSTPFASASTANGGLAFSYNTAPNNTNWTLNGSTVGKTVGFLDGVTHENAHMTSCLVVKTFLDKRGAVLYHGDNGAVVNAFDCTAWQPGGQYVFVGARTAVSDAVHVCKDFSLEYI